MNIGNIEDIEEVFKLSHSRHLILFVNGDHGFYKTKGKYLVKETEDSKS